MVSALRRFCRSFLLYFPHIHLLLFSYLVNKTIRFLFLIIVWAFTPAISFAQFYIDSNKSSEVVAQQQILKKQLSKKLFKKWTKTNPWLSDAILSKIVSSLDTIVAPRYIATTDITSGSKKYRLSYNNLPLGYVELRSGDVTLGWAMLGDKGNYIINAAKAVETDNGIASTGVSANNETIRHLIEDEKAYIVAGIEQEGTLFYEQDSKLMAYNIDTQETQVFTQEYLPEKTLYDGDNTLRRKPLIVALSSVGAAVAIAIIVIAAL